MNSVSAKELQTISALSLSFVNSSASIRVLTLANLKGSWNAFCFGSNASYFLTCSELNH